MEPDVRIWQRVAALADGALERAPAMNDVLSMLFLHGKSEIDGAVIAQAVNRGVEISLEPNGVLCARHSQRADEGPPFLDLHNAYRAHDGSQAVLISYDIQNDHARVRRLDPKPELPAYSDLPLRDDGLTPHEIKARITALLEDVLQQVSDAMAECVIDTLGGLAEGMQKQYRDLQRTPPAITDAILHIRIQ